MMYQIVFLKEIAQVFTYVFLWYFTETRKHRNRSVVVLIILTAISFENNFRNVPCSLESQALGRQAEVQQLSLSGQLANQALVPQLVSMVDQRKTNLKSGQYFVYPRYFSGFQ